MEAAVLPILQMQTSVGLWDLFHYDQVPSTHAMHPTGQSLASGNASGEVKI